MLELADGRRFVRFEDLATSDGPDLHVWVTDQPSGGEWGSYDDGRYVRLGELKATHGNQNYEIPDDVDLAGLRSVVIWCDRFNVAFGTAPVRLGLRTNSSSSSHRARDAGDWQPGGTRRTRVGGRR